MPIRTNRGRAAVYRRLWSWPMRSPVHLAGSVVLFIALVVALGVGGSALFGDAKGELSAGAEETSDTDTDTGSTGVAEGKHDSLPTRLTEPLASPTIAPADPEALRVAQKWASAWAGHSEDMSQEQWLDELRPYTTEEQLPRMRSVELEEIPATKVTGDPEVINSYTSSVEVEMPTDGPTLTILVIRTDSGWRVSAYDEEA